MYLARRIKEVWQQDPRRLVVSLFGWGGLLIAILILTSMTISPSPKVILAGDKQVAIKPLVVKFALPPDREKVAITVEPKIDVSYQWSGGFFGRMPRTLLITPDTNWEVGKSYHVSITNIQGAVGFGKTSTRVESFTVQQLPTISEVNVAAANDVATDQPLAIQLSAPSQGLAEFLFELSPKAEFNVTNNDQSYSLSFVDGLEQGVKYKLTIYRQLIVADSRTGEVERRLSKERIYQTSFTTVAPVLIKSYSPQGQSVLPTNRKISVIFSEKMDRLAVEEGLSLSPATGGRWQWKTDSTLEFTADTDLPIDTSYKVKLRKGIQSQSGSFLDEDETLSFKTVGAVKVVSTTPSNLSSAANLTSDIKLVFDQPVVGRSLQIRITPAVKFNYQLSDRTLTINPASALDYYKTYTLTVESGLKAVYGKPLPHDYQLKFTTELKRVVLNIGLDYQDRALSCEAAALKMALNYRGVNVSEGDIMAIVGYDPTIKSGNVWGDPDVAFVGNIDGSQNSTGYGVHWGPIAKAAKKWRSAAAFTGWTAAKLAGAIEDGNPVVIWGVLGNAYYDPWKTPANRTIAAWKGEHARTVVGYTGSPSNPASFIINDPIVGRIAWSTSTLLSNWGTFNNSGVVVY